MANYITNETGKPVSINVRDAACDICEMFEELLDQHNINIPSADREGDETEARLYGDEYSYMEDSITNLLSEFVTNIRQLDRDDEFKENVASNGVIINECYNGTMGNSRLYYNLDKEDDYRMLSKKYLKDFTKGATVSEVIEALKNYPQDAKVTVLGDRQFYIHGEEDGSEIIFDDSSLDDAYVDEKEDNA